jgi:hypothetical protein
MKHMGIARMTILNKPKSALKTPWTPLWGAYAFARYCTQAKRPDYTATLETMKS